MLLHHLCCVIDEGGHGLGQIDELALIVIACFG
jgi:hypothetical protein